MEMTERRSRVVSADGAENTPWELHTTTANTVIPVSPTSMDPLATGARNGPVDETTGTLQQNATRHLNQIGAEIQLTAALRFIFSLHE